MTIRLVVDASVAISAGESEYPTSSLCRRFLNELIKGDFLVVMTDEIEKEWRDPEKSTFTRTSVKWLARLWGTKKIDQYDSVFAQDLRDAIYALDEPEFSADIRLLMLEDVHLLEASLITDHNIASRDDKVRRHFKRAAKIVSEIQLVAWINPATEEDCFEWLENGCPTEQHRQLGYREQQ